MGSTNDSSGGSTPQSSTRGQQRLSRILEAATELFLKVGYDQTSMDTIVQLSGGSKATLYSYFPTKADLFRAVVDAVVSDVPEPILDASKDIRSELVRFGVERLRVVLSARHRDLMRLVIAERERFPDLAHTYHERGPKLRHDAFTAYLAALQCERCVPIGCPEELSEFFMGMLLHAWYKKLLFEGIEPPDEATIRRHVERVVDRFVQAFGLEDRL